MVIQVAVELVARVVYRDVEVRALADTGAVLPQPVLHALQALKLARSRAGGARMIASKTELSVLIVVGATHLHTDAFLL
jgi:non-canonical (house-cleaning) NTP pyrophosphatase